MALDVDRAGRSGRSARATPTDERCWSRNTGAAPVRGRCATPGSRRPGPPATGTGSARPAATASLLRTALLPTRRGDLRAVGVTVRARARWGLAARQRTAVPGTVRSLPPFESRKHLPSRLARLRELDGRAAVRVRGQGTEFDSLREYVRGDDVRSIDWRASARNRNVVVRTWQPERDRRVVLVLDTSRTSAGRVDDVPRLDSAMDAALLLAALASRAGDRVDFVAGDRRVRARLRSGRRPGRRPNLQDGDGRPRAGHRRGRLGGSWPARSRARPQRALVVLLTPWSRRPSRRGCCPCCRPTATTGSCWPRSGTRRSTGSRRRRGTVDEVYDAAAAEQVLRRRQRTADLLRALGVDVVDADAERLPPALADHYLVLKARGLL